MRSVRRALLLVVLLAVLLALAVTGAALAARGDPQERFTPADQARARAILVRGADLGPAFRSSPPESRNSDFYCRALDESDLTITGKADSRRFMGGTTFVTSTAYVYESVADANASWGRGTSAAGQRCLREGLRGELRGTAVELRSFRKLAFPRLGQRSLLYRATALQQGIPIYLDLLAIQHGRAQAALILGSGAIPPPRSVELELGRLLSRRMAKAVGS